MLLTIPFQIGFGRETLAEKFLLMVPATEEQEVVVLGRNRSLVPLIHLVRNMVGAVDDTNTKEMNNGQMMMD